MDELYDHNVEINDLLEIWEWCSRRLHVRWQRKHKLRNPCYIALAVALSEQRQVPPMLLLKTYRSFPMPLLDREKLAIFWDVQPTALLDLCLGAFTKSSPLHDDLNLLRPSFWDNSSLDDLAKKMRSREKRFGDDWYMEGNHPGSEYRVLKKEIQPLRRALRKLILNAHAVVSELALEILPLGWQKGGEIPVAWLIRKTPEKLLNKANRLKLWRAGHEVLDGDLTQDELLDALLEALHHKISPALRASIEARGFVVDDVICDVIRFDLVKTSDEVTS